MGFSFSVKERAAEPFLVYHPFHGTHHHFCHDFRYFFFTRVGGIAAF